MGEEARKKLETANCCFRKTSECTRTNGTQTFCDSQPRRNSSPAQRGGAGPSSGSFGDRKRDFETEAEAEKNLRQQARKKAMLESLCDDYIKGQVCATAPPCTQKNSDLVVMLARAVQDRRMHEGGPPRPEFHTRHRMLLATGHPMHECAMLLQEPCAPVNAGGTGRCEAIETRRQLARLRILGRTELSAGPRSRHGTRRGERALAPKTEEYGFSLSSMRFLCMVAVCSKGERCHFDRGWMCEPEVCGAREVLPARQIHAQTERVRREYHEGRPADCGPPLSRAREGGGAAAGNQCAESSGASGGTNRLNDSNETSRLNDRSSPRTAPPKPSGWENTILLNIDECPD